MKLTGGKHRYFFISVTLAVFLAVSIAGVVAIGSDIGPHGVASHCPFMPGMNSLCPMNPLAHLTTWQSMFSATFNTTDLIELVMLSITLVGLSVLLVRRIRLLPPLSVLKPIPIYRQKHVAFLDPLREALALGILHPKVYE